MIGRPDPSEHVPYYARYVAYVPGEDILAAFDSETEATRALLAGVSEERSLHRYDTGKWSIRETVIHVVDCERVWLYRALRFARGDEKPLVGFESEEWVAQSNADARPWESIRREYEDVRRATIDFYRGIAPEAWRRSGTADGNRFSVRALAFMTLGHDIHHRNLVRDRYL